MDICPTVRQTTKEECPIRIKKEKKNRKNLSFPSSSSSFEHFTDSYSKNPQQQTKKKTWSNFIYFFFLGPCGVKRKMSIISNFENGIESEPSFDSRTYNVEGGKQNHAISILYLF